MKLFKKCLLLVVLVAVSPISLLLVFLYLTRIARYKTTAIVASWLPGKPGIAMRELFYRMTLKKCGKNLRVFYGAYIVYPDVEIGDNCTIEEASVVSHCTIGNDVIIAAGVSIMSGNKHHDVSDLSRTYYSSAETLRRVFLGDNLWIGTGAIILCDVPSHVAVGAGAVVVKVCKEYDVVGGNPARTLYNRVEKFGPQETS